MRINKLLKKIFIDYFALYNHEISDCFSNSKITIEDSVFVCIKGSKVNGHDYVSEAIKNGAKTIIYSEELTEQITGINYIKVDNTKKVYSQIITILFKDITKNMYLIGVTGTNGKTTVTTILHSFLEYMGHGCLYIGTNTIEYLNNRYQSSNTTPDIKVIYEHLRIAKKENIKYVVMEVSSIAVMELRVLDFKFHVMALTNISQDHLDYHKNMTHYTFSKLLSTFLVEKGNNYGLVLNKDDENFDLFSMFYSGKIISYGMEKSANMQGKIINKTFREMIFTINELQLRSYLIGKFNIYNILCVAGILKIIGFSVIQLQGFLKCFYKVDGRMNIYGLKDKIVVIDYAHTPEGVKNILETIKDVANSRLTVVIGAGGNRDKEKRPLIGEVLEKYADRIILTNDNPRDEEPLKIVNDIAQGLKKEYIIELDRKKAIEKAILESIENEVIAILGKGCEEKQIFKNETIEFSDIEVVKEIVGG